MDTSTKIKYAPVPLRLIMGVILALAGYMKVTAIEGTIAYFARMDFPAPVITAWFIALLELLGGLALLLGLFVRYLGLLFAIQFFVATFWVKFPAQGYAGARLDLMLLAGALALYLLGSGRWSIDSLWSEKERSKSPI